MQVPDFEKSKAYALKRLNEEIPSTMVYHSLQHTRDEVAPAAERLAELENLNGEDRTLLFTAVYFHDLGYIKGLNDHEESSARIASQVLPRFGYSSRQINIIRDMIMATKMPQSPHTHAEQILADSDLDVLGAENYFSRSEDLRQELASGGKLFSDIEWFTNQLNLLENHSYFCISAQQLRDAGKKKNIVLVKDMINMIG
jgi:predicted metal-dependent HD superfamily phosphohydrolase